MILKLKRPCSACKKPLFISFVTLIGISYMGTRLTYWFNCNYCNSTMTSYDKEEHEALELAEKGEKFNDLRQ